MLKELLDFMMSAGDFGDGNERERVNNFPQRRIMIKNSEEKKYNRTKLIRYCSLIKKNEQFHDNKTLLI